MRKTNELETPRLSRRGWANGKRYFLLAWLLFPLVAWGQPYAGVISVELQNASLLEALRQINRAGNNCVSFKREVIERVGTRVSLNEREITVRGAVERCIAGTSLVLMVEGDNLLVTPGVAARQPVVVTGRVTEANGAPLVGVTVMLKGTRQGTATDRAGNFSLTVDEDRPTLTFTFIGMNPVEAVYEGKPLSIVMRETEMALGEVVVTGIFERKAESFTGSVASYSGTELKRVGTKNVIQSLRTLDPSFRVTPDNLFGSDPNRLPDINIRGKSSISNIESEWGDDPNRPIFIMDGFEVDLQTVIDLSMDRVASLHILKDAASTAMYGSRAANGVVVIETVKPQAGMLQFSYNGNYNAELPDLTDYNMMNAEEKLAFEKATGFYDRVSTTTEKVQWDNLYNKRLADVREGGVDSYWLSEPLRVGFTHRHSVRVTGGDRSMYYSFGLTYSGNEGVMKQSKRDVIGGNVNLQYRREGLRLSNDITFDYTLANNAPVSFYEYVRANPYYKKEINPEHPEYLDYYRIVQDNGGANVYYVTNPLYNASLKHVNQSKSNIFRNNLRVEYSLEDVKFAGKVSLSKSIGKTETFKSPYHTDFLERSRVERGSYTKSSSENMSYNGDLSVTFGKVYAESHQVNAVGRLEVNSTTRENDSYVAIGFPSDRVSNPAFAISYPTGKPGYGESFKRAINMMFTANYGYKGRYLIDATYRRDGSSNFGANKLWTNTWSVGVAWNIHNEEFVGEWARTMKLRAAYGNPGNNNQAFDTFLAYSYNTNLQNIFGLGAQIYSYGNANLDWQKTNDLTVGFDLVAFDGRISAILDFYQKVTNPLIIQVGMAPSTGKSTLVTNLGMNTINGITFKIDARVLENKEKNLRWSINAHGYHETSKYSRIGNSLDRFNDELRNTSVYRYRDGASSSDIWTVRSAGIDPMSGQEIFIRKDGSYTFTYDAGDEVVCGNTLADLEGVIGTTFHYRGFSLRALFRYSFGGDYFNNELYNRIENIGYQIDSYNQDKRAYYDRWKQAGDYARYRDIRLYTADGRVYPKSDRYVQKNNFFTGESIAAGYNFIDNAWLKTVGLRALAVDVTLNELFRWSTVKAERGINYPFARTLSLSLNVSF
ncbi:MAG: SusC/RagA family TonB-linked outer membrane protein [Odoribacteraceae bacterium]|jgi:TonB-linked SusC/RagA family outer membrane protein|nr:SusC/RagA family TonB-linked outer membrane protein [Odoribacteraceae bacterium]